jgi:type I restriction enzyme S subunit
MAGERVEMPLGEICQVKQGKYLAPGQMSELRTPETPVPVYGAGGILGYTDQVMFDEPVALVTCRGSNCGMLQRTEGRAWVSNNAMACPPKTPNKNRFVYYLLLASKFRDVTTGSAQPQITATHLNAKLLTIATDPNEQQSIASVLGALDDKIELNRRMNETLEALAQNLFKSWFVDTTQAGLPKGWRVSELPQEIDFLEGPGLRNWQYRDEGMKFLNIRCINDGDLDIAKANAISLEEFEKTYRHFALREDDIVISTSGTLGRLAIVRSDHVPVMLNTSIIRMRGRGAVGLAYLWGFLQSQFFLEEMFAAASGSVQLNFGPMHLKKITMLRPPDDLLMRFEQVAQPLIKRALRNRHESRTLAALRDALLPKLLSGELRVPAAGVLNS